MHGAEEMNKQDLRQWNEVSSVKHHRRNYIWLLDNERLHFVSNMLQLVLWLVPTLRPLVTYSWQMSSSECYTHFCSLAALFWAMSYSRGQIGDLCHSWSCRFNASRWTIIITTKTTECKDGSKSWTSPLLSSCQNISLYGQSWCVLWLNLLLSN